MLTPWDEFLCHQLPTTMDHVYTTGTYRTDSPRYGIKGSNTIFAHPGLCVRIRTRSKLVRCRLKFSRA